MDQARLRNALTGLLGASLAEELAHEFVALRQEVATATLGRASCGKFVETFVQCLQHVATGTYDAKPNVDGYLSTKAENEVALPEGLRICGTRIARAIYTLRNKRNIAHKNPVDPNVFDLMMCHQGAAWIMAELLRCATGVSMGEAGALIQLVQAPVNSLVEEIDGRRLVHADLPLKAELLILLHSHYPDHVKVAELSRGITTSSPASIRARLSELVRSKLAISNSSSGYRLTQAGHRAAVAQINLL